MDTPILSSRLLLGMFEVLDQGILLLDQNGRILLWNQWLAGKSGLPAEQLLGRPWLESFPALADSRLDQAVQQALQRRMPSLITPYLNKTAFPLGHPDRPVLQSIRVLPLFDEAEQQLYCVVQITDVSNEIQREKLLREKTEQLQELTRRDPLTGIGNRKLFDDTLAAELARQRRIGHPVALAMIDIDYFKAYNDQFGHQAGDHCLILVSQTLRSALKRLNDVVCRFGGEEFALILPNTDLQGAENVALDIRQQLARDARGFKERVTVSIGIAISDPEQPLSAEVLVAKADSALYAAKRDGRDCVRNSNDIQ
jgi:diguanylate cyclase (GGDEF)-like protein/PAS domain S-box-containing protein